MGLLDSVIGNVAGNLLGGGAQGGGQGQMVQVLLSMLSQGGGQGGGLGDLLGKFQQAGLGEVASSWVGTGANLPISADQLTSVLGSDTLGALAGQLGLDQGAATGQLAQMLPGVIDALTPNGELPSSGGADLGGLASQVLGQLLQR